ncbi:hypothetical protein BLNAU_9517 [Blattamonas nauphoetae]|uniref:Uncharacterized protein n=1 Tax=Blattamonas nauphoetae TaxID=2049346 RepID=A0ABQ9XVG4_9EUKA|nr:hypothetical protein BLNAU_9517 [Blattamonas nauphoetae]
MEKETTVAVTPTKYAFSNNSQESRSITDTLLKSVLKYPSNSRLTFEEESTIYNSLVALLKMGYPFDNALQDRAVQFLKYFTPYFGNRQRSEKFVTDLVHSSAGAPSGFVESICTLLASPFSAVIAETMQLLFISTKEMYAPIRYLLVASDLISRTITAFQPQTRPISGNEEIHSRLAGIINNVIIIADPSWLRSHMITGPVDICGIHTDLVLGALIMF